MEGFFIEVRGELDSKSFLLYETGVGLVVVLF